MLGFGVWCVISIFDFVVLFVYDGVEVVCVYVGWFCWLFEKFG